MPGVDTSKWVRQWPRRAVPCTIRVCGTTRVCHCSALAVVLERDPAHTPLYGDLRAQLQLLAEVELEIS
jgi:hypothetical protein